MRMFTRGYAMYPGHMKMIFFSLFLSQLLANYVVVQRWILPRDIIKEMPLRTVTSCVMKCSGLDKCANVGFRKNPATTKNDKCLLIRTLRKKNKNGTRIKIYAFVDVQTAVKDEKEERLTLAKQQACPVDVNGGYGNWSVYTICTKSCGSGLQYRNRTCADPTPMYGGRNCSILGKASEVRSCNDHPCPIDGGYGQWSSYEICTKSCATGEQQRSRSCDTPIPQYGGRNCTSLGKSTETRSCNMHPCPVDGGYGQWSSYGTCSKSCATGEQQRSRLCDAPTPQHGGKDCTSLGKQTETRSCNTDPCPGWPEGAYGILISGSCPTNWYEFTQCYMAESGTSITSTFSRGTCNTGSSMILRYCFKGSNVPSRKGGFFTKSGSVGSTYVIKNVNSPCTVFGSEGNHVYIDAEDEKSKVNAYGNSGINLQRTPKYYPHKSVGSNDIQLYFCIIGEQKGSATSENIRIGEFNQKFGLFSAPDSSQCPDLDSPRGKLHGTKEIISFHSESKTNPSSSIGGAKIPFVVGSDKYSVKFGVCVYNP